MLVQKNSTINYYRRFNPYGLAKYIVLITGIAMIILIPLDWAFPSGTKASELGADEVDRLIPQAIRGAILILLIVYIGLTGFDPGAYGFISGRALVLLAAYMFLSVFFFDNETTLNLRLQSLAKSMPWMVAAIASYRLTLGGFLSQERIRKLAGFVVILCASYTISNCIANGLVGQNADGSVLLWCIPLLLLARAPFWALSLSGLAAIAILMTVKRGSILALFAGLLFYGIILISTSSRQHKKRVFIIVALILATMTGGLLWQQENIQYRVDKDNIRGDIGSGRSAFYRVIIEEWYNGNFISFLFGKGLLTVPTTLESKYGAKIYAHSDWLEILHDMGVIGITLFVYLNFRIITVVISALWKQHAVASALAMGYLIFALRNIYSQCLVETASDTIYFGLLLGYSCASLNIMGNQGLRGCEFADGNRINDNYRLKKVQHAWQMDEP